MAFPEPKLVPLLLLVILLTGHGHSDSDAKQASRKPNSISLPVPYNIRGIRRNKSQCCSLSSPEIFFDNIAQPSLNLLYHRCKAMFGILMDEIEASYATAKLPEDLKNKTKEQWEFLAETVTTSLDSTVDRLEAEWEYFIVLNDVPLLPWEKSLRLPLIYESINRVEYGYLMVESVLKSGVKEVVGTLQHQLTDVIMKLDKEMPNYADGKVSEVTALKQMKKGLSKMQPSFATGLLNKVVDKALESRTKSNKNPKKETSRERTETFISESLNQMAIVIHAFREKGFLHPYFWAEMSTIYEREFKISSRMDMESEIEKFFRTLITNKDYFIDLIVQIISRENK